jgi:hypothetical protein
MRFEVLTVVNMKMAVFGDVALCSLAKFSVSEVLAASIIRAMMMEAASTSETSINFYQTHGATTQKTAIFSIVLFTRVTKI